MTKARRLHAANANSRLNVHSLANFLHRISVELDIMRGRMFDHERAKLEEGTPALDPRLMKLLLARDKIFQAHSALLDAQRELTK